jgi:hypothetical protein
MARSWRDGWMHIEEIVVVRFIIAFILLAL